MARVTAGAYLKKRTIDMKNMLIAFLVFCLAFPLYAAEVVNSGATNPVAPYGDYINFGTKIGSPGYGFRTNNGTIESKNLAGSWGTLGNAAYPINLAGGTETTGILPESQGGFGTSTPKYVRQDNGSSTTQLATNITMAGTSTFPSGVWGSTGSLGVGTTTPETALHVIGGITISGNVDGRDISADGTTLDSHTADTTDPHGATLTQSNATIAGVAAPYIAQTNGTGTGITLAGNTTLPGGIWNSSGNVGIGTTNITEKLTLGDGVTAGGVVARLNATAANWAGTGLNKAGTEKWFIGMGDTSTYGDKFLIRRTSSADDMVIDTAGNVGIGSNAPLQKAYVAGNVQATGEFIEGTGSIVSTAAIIPYIQLSSTANQVPVNTAETLLTYTNVDEQQTFSFTPTSGVITIPENGVYFFIAGGQAGKASGGTLRFLDMWIKKNDVDVPRSSVRNSISAAADTKVVIQNTALRCNAGDTIKTYIAVSSAADGSGLYATTPGVGPVIPSIIVTIFKVSQ